MSYNEYVNYSIDPVGRPRFYGIYRGVVVDNVDPSGQNKLSIMVPQVTGGGSFDDVPASSPQTSTSITPEIGSQIWVMFESGDPEYPVWMGSSSGSSTGVTSVDGLTGAVTLSGTYLTQTNAASTYEPKITAGTTAQYWRGDKTWQTFPTIPTAFTGYDYEIHVSQVDGNDTTGNGDLLTPVASITKALTLVTSSRKTIIVHPGGYTESPSITTQYTTITGPGLIGGNIVLYGTLSASVGCTISGIKMTNLTVTAPTGTGNVNILNCEVSGTFTKSSNADYTVLRLCDFNAASITGAGLVAIFGGNPNFITVNNASANVIVKSAITVAPVLTAGTLSLVDSVVGAAVTNAVTSAASSIITLANCQFLTSALTGVAPVVLNGFYSILNCVYDKPNSTLVASSGTGGSTNSVDYFQYINADKFITQGGTSSQFVKGDGSLDSTVNAATVTNGVYTNVANTFTTGQTVSSTGDASLTLNSGTSGAPGNQISFVDMKLDGVLKGNIAINEGTTGTPLEINSAATTDVVLVTGGGNVGIGTSAPTAKLDVNGTVKATTFSGSLTGDVTGNVTGSSGSTTGKSAGISGSQTANTVYAAPDGTAGLASFRALTATDIPNLSATKITSGVMGNTIAAAPAWFYTNYADVSAGTVASAVAIPMFNKSVALAASTIYEIDLSWLITLTTGTTVNTPRLWWNYSGTVDATNPINWEARYTQVSGSTPFSTAETAGNTNQVYPVTAVKLGTTTSPLSAGPGYLASTSYVSKIVGKAIIRTSTAGNLSFNIQAGTTTGNPGYTAFNTKAGSFMRVTPMGTNSGADFSIGTWA